MKLGIYQLYGAIQPRLRKRRFQLFLEALKPTAETRILDVGGYVVNWLESGIPSRVTCVNLDPPSTQAANDRITYCQGDACNLNFPDKSFDIVFSNSVIEHVGSWAKQERFAAEARRVGRQVFVQTPNRWFPVEPHFITLFVHFLPWNFAKRIIRFCSFRGWVRSGDNVNLQSLADELGLLSSGQLHTLFPDCDIYGERLLGLTKSLMAVRRDRAAPPGFQVDRVLGNEIPPDKRFALLRRASPQGVETQSAG